jgi:hypothetical protein
MSATLTRSRCPAREELRGLVGDVADELSDRQCGKVLGVVFATVKRELDTGNPDQLTLTVGASR